MTVDWLWPMKCEQRRCACARQSCKSRHGAHCGCPCNLVTPREMGCPTDGIRWVPRVGTPCVAFSGWSQARPLLQRGPACPDPQPQTEGPQPSPHLPLLLPSAQSAPSQETDGSLGAAQPWALRARRVHGAGGVLGCPPPRIRSAAGRALGPAGWGAPSNLDP